MISDAPLHRNKILKLFLLFALGGFAGWMVHGIQSLAYTTPFFMVMTNHKTGEQFAIPAPELSRLIKR